MLNYYYSAFGKKCSREDEIEASVRYKIEAFLRVSIYVRLVVLKKLALVVVWMAGWHDMAMMTGVNSRSEYYGDNMAKRYITCKRKENNINA